MTPAFEFPFVDRGTTCVALVYEVDIDLGVRDVTVFQVYNGWFRYLGCGVFGKRFVRVGTLHRKLAKAVDVVLIAGMAGHP